MKTVFVTSFHSLIGRNILRTDAFSSLARKHRVVLLVPDFKKAYFEREFGGPSVLVEGISTKLLRRESLFVTLSLLLLPTRTLAIKRSADFLWGKSPLRTLAAFTGFLLLAPFRWVSFCGKILRFFDTLLSDRACYKVLLERYKPNLIFSTDLQHPLDVRLLQNAQRASIATLAMVRSWDNITAKGIFRVLPDRLLVHNTMLAKEAYRYDGLGNERVGVIGIPHYDRYRAVSSASREAFLKNYGLDPSKKLILFGPIGDRYIYGRNNTDCKVLAALSTLPVNVLVRMPPADSVDFRCSYAASANVAFQVTGTRSWKDQYGQDSSKVNEISGEDDETLIAALQCADVAVVGPSTLCVDAAAFDRPLILSALDGTPVPYHKSVRRYYDYDHFAPIVESGGAPLVYSEGELLEQVQDYLDDPTKDQAGRQRIVELECYKFDGNSSRRLWEELAQALHDE